MRPITTVILVAKSVGSQVWACRTVYMSEKPRKIMGVSGMTFALLGFFDFATSITTVIGCWRKRSAQPVDACFVGLQHYLSDVLRGVYVVVTQQQLVACEADFGGQLEQGGVLRKVQDDE